MKKRIATLCALATVLSISAVSALAADPDVTSLMSSGMDSVKGDIMGVLAVAVPVLIAIAGAVVGINFGLKYIKKLGHG